MAKNSDATLLFICLSSKLLPGEGDKALRQMVKSTDIHSHKQVNTGGLHEQKVSNNLNTLTSEHQLLELYASRLTD